MTSIAREHRKVALQRTPLYNLHIRSGAKMVELAGYSMPVQAVVCGLLMATSNEVRRFWCGGPTAGKKIR